MSRPRASEQDRKALEEKVARLAKSNPAISDRKIAKDLHVRRTVISEIRRKLDIPSNFKSAAERSLEPGPSAYADIRGVYIGDKIQVVVIVTNNLQVIETDLRRMSHYTAADRLPLTPASKDRILCAKLGAILADSAKSRRAAEQFRACPATWLSKLDLHASEKPHILVSGSKAKLRALSNRWAKEVIVVDGASLANSLTNIMLSPELGTLGCAAFPSLAILLQKLKSSTVAQLKSDHTIRSLRLRSALAKKLGLTGIYISEEQAPAKQSSGQKLPVSFTRTSSRVRKSLFSVSDGVQRSPLFPLPLRIPGAEIVSRNVPDEFFASSYVLETEELRKVFAGESIVDLVLNTLKRAIKIQKKFISDNNKEPLIKCCELISQDPQWFSDVKRIKNAINTWDASETDKARMMASLWVATFDGEFMARAIGNVPRKNKQGELSRLINSFEEDYTLALLKTIEQSRPKLLGQSAKLTRADDAASVLDETIQDFVATEAGTFLRRAMEIVSSFVQGQIEAIALKGIVRCPAEEILHRDKEIISILAGPWPQVKFNFRSIESYLSKRFSGALYDGVRKKSAQTFHEEARLGRQSLPLHNGRQFEFPVAGSGVVTAATYVANWIKSLLRVVDYTELEENLMKAEATAKKADGGSAVFREAAEGDLDLPERILEAARAYFLAVAQGKETGLRKARDVFIKDLRDYAAELRSFDGLIKAA